MPRKRKLDEVINDAEPIEGAYKCDVCGQTFLRGCGLASHVKKHTPVVFECAQCDYRCKHKPSYERHFATTHMNIMESGPLVVINDGYKANPVPILMREIKREIVEEDGEEDMDEDDHVEPPKTAAPIITKMSLRATPKVTPRMAERDCPPRVIAKAKPKLVNNATSVAGPSEPPKAVNLPITRTAPVPIVKKTLKEAVVIPAISKKEDYTCPMCPEHFSCSQRMAFHIMCHRTKSHQAPRGIKYFSKRLGERRGMFKLRSPQMKRWRLSFDNRSVDQKRAQRLWHMELNFGHSIPSSRLPILNIPESSTRVNGEVKNSKKNITRKKLKMRSGEAFGQKITHEGTHYYLCRHCPFTTWNVSSLWRHGRNHVQRSKQGWTCISCSFTSSIRVRVDLHVKLHKEFAETEPEYLAWVRYERRTNKSDLDKPGSKKMQELKTLAIPAPIVSQRPLRMSLRVPPAKPILPAQSMMVPMPRPTKRRGKEAQVDLGAIMRMHKMNAEALASGDYESENVQECNQRVFVLPPNSKFAAMVKQNETPEPSPEPEDEDEEPPELERMAESPPKLERMVDLPPILVVAKKTESVPPKPKTKSVTFLEPKEQVPKPTNIAQSTPDRSVSQTPTSSTAALKIDTPPPAVLTPCTTSSLTPSAPAPLTPNESTPDANKKPVVVPVAAKETKKEKVQEPISKEGNKPVNKPPKAPPITYPVAKPVTRAMTKSGLSPAPPTLKDIGVVKKVPRTPAKVEIKKDVESDNDQEAEADNTSKDKSYKRPAKKPTEEVSMEPVRKSTRLSSRKQVFGAASGERSSIQSPAPEVVEKPVQALQAETVKEPEKNLEKEQSHEPAKDSTKKPVQLPVKQVLEKSADPLPSIQIEKSVTPPPKLSSVLIPINTPSKSTSREPSLERASSSDRSREDSLEPPPLFKMPIVVPKIRDFVHFEPGRALFNQTRHPIETYDLFGKAWDEYKKKANAPPVVNAGIKFIPNLSPIAQAQIGRNNPREYLLRELEIERSRECPDCPFKNYDLKKFRLHRDRHYHVGRHKCKECSYSSHNPHQVQDHMYVDHYLSDVRQAEGLPSSESEEEEEAPPLVDEFVPEPRPKQKRRRRRANW
ncbi:CBN-SPR-3 protein [Caenorhabditis brenneri]|uniref:CBN-SPR-3 protein n=1 Tax=Caenorhabditis brenneri TaxID=135651 RepID=G0M851_CAEBE|nr:CBN-SPR-3 protein [Caenorhabditis brenneri]